MRRKQRRSEASAAHSLLSASPTYHLATIGDQGQPVLRTLNGAVVDDWVLFHGALVGEKVRALGHPAVVTAYETIAAIPSHFVDAERACPATTYYRSVQASGTLQSVESRDLKARMLQALMSKYQPEGGYRRFDTSREFYEAELKGVSVFGLQIEELSGKESLGQDRPPERTKQVVEGLWRRGDPGDMAAIATILQASPQARPERFALHAGELPVLAQVFATDDLANQHADLLEFTYWRKDSTKGRIVRAILASNAWIGLTDEHGKLYAAGRAVSDEVWVASIFDVVVAEPFRGLGLGTALMELLLAHPGVKRASFVKLGTRDAMDFYERFGFQLGTTAGRNFSTSSMTRAQ